MYTPQIFSFVAMFHPGMSELLIILFIGFLIFGAKRIPEIAHSLGKGIKDFQVGLKEPQNEEVQKLVAKRDLQEPRE